MRFFFFLWEMEKVQRQRNDKIKFLRGEFTFHLCGTLNYNKDFWKRILNHLVIWYNGYINLGVVLYENNNNVLPFHWGCIAMECFWMIMWFSWMGNNYSNAMKIMYGLGSMDSFFFTSWVNYWKCIRKIGINTARFSSCLQVSSYCW